MPSPSQDDEHPGRATAHISTYGTQVADMFFVKDNFGMKITRGAKMKQVRGRLMEVVVGYIPAKAGIL